MSYFQGNYLRVLTPQTIDGINLAYDKNNQPIFKETHLPVTARKHLDKKNLKLPIQLRKQIELVDVESAPVRIVAKPPAVFEPEVEQEAETDVETQPVKPKGKPGPKPKETNTKTDDN